MFAALSSIVCVLGFAEPVPTSKTTVTPPPKGESDVPALYRMDAAPFAAERTLISATNGIRHESVKYPSPYVSGTPENDTVYCELFRPNKPGRYPCVVVLHIAGGDFPMARMIAASLAGRGCAGLFMKMPYYGERRPAKSKSRLISADLERGMSGVKQAVLDIRRACDWAAAQPDLDGNRLGVMGVSLGAIVGGLAAAIEPRLTHVCLVMGAGELQHILYESSERKAKELLGYWKALGGTRETLGAILRPIDVATYGDRLAKRNVLTFTAAYDEVLPRACGLALAKATGGQRNVVYPCGHYSMALYLPTVMMQSTDFFATWPAARLPPYGKPQ